MRDPKRIRPMLAEIERLWMTAPDLRLGQIIANATPRMCADGCCDPFYIEDAELMASIRNVIAEPNETARRFANHAPSRGTPVNE